MLAFSVRISAFFGVMTSLAHAQCANTWLVDDPSHGAPGIDGAPGIINQLVVLGPEDFIVGGQVTLAGVTHFVARRTNGVWSALGSGTDAPVNALLRLPNGDIVAGGQFTTAGGVATNHVARWNGTAWSPLGAGCDNTVNALARLPNGDIVATGAFMSAGGVGASCIARWNGATWSPLGSGLTTTFIGNTGQHLIVTHNGDLVVFGEFTIAGGVPAMCVARWNGTAWSAMGAGTSSGFTSVTQTPNGDLYAAGFGALGFPAVVRWDGVSWQVLPMPNSLTMAITALPDGDVLARTGFGSQGRVTRLHGTTWTDVAVVTGYVTSLVWADDGDLFAVGGFTQIDGKATPGFARLRTSCPALAVANGAGCPSSGGANTLVATSRPWLGGTFATAGSGLPANAIVAVVRGFAPASLPLVSALPQGQPGCVLHVAPELLDVVVPLNGAAAASLPLPAVPSLVGLTFGEQWVPLELGPSLEIVAMTSTNSLRMTVGVF